VSVVNEEGAIADDAEFAHGAASARGWSAKS